MKRFKLHRKLIIEVRDLNQTIYTDRYPHVYLNTNAIYFSDKVTDDPIRAFEMAVPMIFFDSTRDASMAFYTIKQADREGYDCIVIKEQDLHTLSIKVVKSVPH